MRICRTRAGLLWDAYSWRDVLPPRGPHPSRDEQAVVNFGGRPFVYDLEAMVAEEKDTLASMLGEVDVQAEFLACNLNDEEKHLERSKDFLKSIGKQKFDLTSIFSTTMWIHIHSGDDGLVAFLERACSLTEYLLVEPQPSKW